MVLVALLHDKLAHHAAAVVFEGPGSFHQFAPVDAEAHDLLAGQQVHAFEFDGLGEIEQFGLCAHPGDIG